jgi:hypothetical protein
MNIFPTNLQYFITNKHFENNKNIIKLYTDPNYTNKKLIRYYDPKKIIKEKIKIDTKFLIDDATECGNIRLIKWLKENGCPWRDTTFEYAAYYGNLDNMKWLLENGCPWNFWTFEAAAEHGNLENMKWLFKKGCPWSKATFAHASYYGNLENMIFLFENGCPWDSWAFYLVKNLENIKWLKENGCPET